MAKAPIETVAPAKKPDDRGPIRPVATNVDTLRVVAVKFERDRPMNLGPKFGVLDHIDLRDRKAQGNRVVKSRHAGFFSLFLRGPLLFVRYKGPLGKRLEAVPVVGCVRQLSFEEK